MQLQLLDVVVEKASVLFVIVYILSQYAEETLLAMIFFFIVHIVYKLVVLKFHFLVYWECYLIVSLL